MISLRTLGAIDLRAADGRELSTVLAQPKRMALLIYLAVARPRPPGFHRRDRLVAMFWPEADQARARQALSKSVHQLRRALGDDALISRGDDDLALSESLVDSDARQVDDALAAGDHVRALELYGGDLAAGLFIDDAPEFERWLDGERSRLRDGVAQSAVALSREALGRGDVTIAVERAKQAAALLPGDEPVARCLMSALAAAGDRAGALRAYEDFAARLALELDSEPSAETRALAASLRRRDVHPPSLPERLGSAPPPALERAAPLQLPESGNAIAPLPATRRPWHRPLAAALLAVGLLAVVVTVRGSLRERPAAPAQPRLHPNRVLVAVLENQTGDSTLDPVGMMAMDYMRQGIASAALVEVVDPSAAVFAARGVDSLRGRRDGAARMALALAVESGAGLVISGAYHREGDSLRFRANLTDVGRSTVARSFQMVSAPIGAPTDALGDLRRQAVEIIAEAVEPRLLEFSRASPRPPSYPAYLEYVRGIDLYTQREESSAFGHFVRAFELDTSFTLALLNAAGSAITTEDDRVDGWLDMLASRRETLPRIQQLWLDNMLARRRQDREEGYRSGTELARLAPGSMWPYFNAMGTFERGYARRALDILLAIDPERGWMKGWYTYWPFRGMVRHTMGEHEAELADAKLAQRLFPGNLATVTAKVRALTVLGRREEVFAEIDSVQTLPDQGGWNVGSAIGVAALEAGTHGHADWIPQLRERALRWYDALPEDERNREAPIFGHSWVLYTTEAWPQLATRLDRLRREIPPRPELIAYGGILAARRGDRAAALVADSLLRVKFPLDSATNWMERFRSGEAIYRRAQIAAALGDRERALTILRTAFVQGYASRFYVHCEPAFESLRGDPEFRQLIAVRD